MRMTVDGLAQERRSHWGKPSKDRPLFWRKHRTLMVHKPAQPRRLPPFLVSPPPFTALRTEHLSLCSALSSPQTKMFHPLCFCYLSIPHQMCPQAIAMGKGAYQGGGPTQGECLLSHSVLSNSLQPHGLQPARFVCPLDFPSKNNGVGCHILLQGIFSTQEWNPGLLHYRRIRYCLSHQESLYTGRG